MLFRTGFKTKKYLFALPLLLAIISCRSPINVYDGFETPGLNKIWGTDRMEMHSFQIQSAIVRKGTSAAKITLQPGDVFEAGVGKSKDSERDELREADQLVSDEGKIYEYQFSLFLPDSFPIVPTRLVIAQWKQHCGGDSACSDASPVMAIRFVSGKLFITVQTDSGTKTVYQTTDEIRNQWLDFKFKVRFSRSENGLIDGWLNGKPIINFKGINCYSSKKGYADHSYFYFKTGLYRDLMTVPMTIYIDEYSKKELAE
ncbi:MAG: polysaccharide lyase [Ferruginibacter sp.]